MQEKHLFEYAVIRVIPRVEREEFMNIGVILYCAQQSFLQVAFDLNKDRLLVFSKDLDIQAVEEYIQIFQRICKGGKQGGTIGQLPLASRFRWLTSSCSTIVQPSPVHPGLCENAKETLDKLLVQLVQ